MIIDYLRIIIANLKCINKSDLDPYPVYGKYLDCYILDVLWGQLIKFIQVASNSELRENQWNDLLFFEIVPSHCFGASEVQTLNRS